MEFGFRARGGTAPALTTMVYGNCSNSGRPNPSYDQVDGGDDTLGLPKSVVCTKMQGKKGVPRASARKRVTCGYRRTRAGGRNRYVDGIGSTGSVRPISREALSDLMDLNLALKCDNMENSTDTNICSHEGLGSRGKPRLERCATGNESKFIRQLRFHVASCIVIS